MPEVVSASCKECVRQEVVSAVDAERKVATSRGQLADVASDSTLHVAMKNGNICSLLEAASLPVMGHHGV